jgi:hypothetical protein
MLPYHPPTQFKIRTDKKNSRGRILGRNWDKVLRVFILAIQKSPLLTDFTPPPPPLSKGDLKLVCTVNIVYGNLKSKIFQDYALKFQLNCTFMNSVSGSEPQGQH